MDFFKFVTILKGLSSDLVAWMGQQNNRGMFCRFIPHQNDR